MGRKEIRMNLSVLLGRLVNEPELQSKERNDSTTYWCWFRIAVDREYAKEKEADFFNCVAYGGRARYLVSYARKGGRLLLVGRVKNGDYTNKEGKRAFFTEIVVEDCQIIDYADDKTEREG